VQYVKYFFEITSICYTVAVRYIKNLNVYDRGIAQLVEHWSPKPGVVGSSPATPATNIQKTETFHIHMIIRIALSLIAILVLAYAIPAIVISSGIEAYSGQEKLYAQRALDDVELHLSSPSLYKLYTTKIAVGGLKPTNDTNCPYSATATLYTFMGYKYATLIVRPGCSVTPL
jgi:hypothetical protein